MALTAAEYLAFEKDMLEKAVFAQADYILENGGSVEDSSGEPVSVTIGSFSYSYVRIKLSSVGSACSAAKNPPHSSAVPHRAAHRGPRLSCRKPPMTHPTPNAAMRMPKA